MRDDDAAPEPPAGTTSGQERISALIIAAAALVVFPAWSGFDVLLEPQLASTFMVVRLVALVPIASADWLLCFRPHGPSCSPSPSSSSRRRWSG